MLTIELDDPGTYGRVVRDRRRRGRARGRGQSRRRRRPPTSWRSARSTPAPTPSTPRRWPTPSPDSPTTTPRASTTCPTSSRRCARRATRSPPTSPTTSRVTMGVNNRVDLAAVEAEARRRILEAPHARRRHRRRPRLDLDRRRRRDRRRRPDRARHQPARRAPRSAPARVVGPLTTLIDTELGDEVTVPHSYLVECEVARRLHGRPLRLPAPRRRARARAPRPAPSSRSRTRAIGEGAKVPHLAYVGDADVGAGSNLGAGTITANYDGFRKNRTVIGADVRHRR